MKNYTSSEVSNDTMISNDWCALSSYDVHNSNTQKWNKVINNFKKKNIYIYINNK